MTSQPQTDQYYGTSSSVQQVSGLRLAERTYSAGFKSPLHSHSDAYFCLILDGRSLQTYGSKQRIREPQTITFYPPNELQSESFGRDGGRIFNVEVDLRWLGYFREYSVIREESTDFRGGSLAWLTTRLYNEFHRKDHASALAIEGVTLEIIAEASRKITASRSRCPRWLEQARDVLHENFAENLTLGTIAEIVGVHPVHLASSFRKQYHCTIGDYRRRLRVEFACRAIGKSHFTLAQIALAAGFANQPHLSREFKRMMGMTPAEYRAKFPRA